MDSKIKPRKCKSKSCRELFTPKRYNLVLQKFCCEACELTNAENTANKAYKLQTLEMKRAFNAKSVPFQHKQNKLTFNKLRRLEEFKWFKDHGLEPTCISCGGELGEDQWSCGHFKTDKGRLRYDRMNTYLQHNVRCNKNLSADIHGTSTTHGYLKGLSIRFGEEDARRIIDYCETNTGVKKWVAADMAEDRKNWNIQIRKLEEELK